MSQPTPPKIEFPCENYPIKVMGDACEDFRQLVVEVVERHAPGFDARSVRVRDSRNGRYQSLTVWITATGEPQLRAINEDLRASPLTKMVL